MDGAALGEVVQDGDRIVADRRDADPECFELLPAVLQFDQLALTIRSPVRRSKEDDGGAVGSQQVFQRVSFSVLVRRFEGWHRSADRWAVIGGKGRPERCESGECEERTHGGEGSTAEVPRTTYYVLRTKPGVEVREVLYVVRGT